LEEVVNFTVQLIENNLPVSGQAVTFASTRGVLSSASGTTDANGQATVTLSSNNSGISELTVSNLATGSSSTIAVEFVATSVDSLTLQPDLVNVVAGESTLVKATVRDGNNLVKNQTVVFSVDDPTGGTISPGSAITDSSGVARTYYRAGNTTSATGGVTLSAYVQGFEAVQDSVQLTVGGQEFRFDIGTGNEIEELSAHARNKVNVVLFSPRRYGKTSLVKRLQADLQGDGFFTVYADFFMVTSMNDVAERIAKSIYAALHRRESLLEKGVRYLKTFTTFRPVFKPSPDGGMSISVEPVSPNLSGMDLLDKVMEELGRFVRSQPSPSTHVAFDEFQEIRMLDVSLRKERERASKLRVGRPCE